MTDKIPFMKIDVEKNIKENYSNEICSNCDNTICKVYGGRCGKYNKTNSLINAFNRRYGKKRA